MKIRLSVFFAVAVAITLPTTVNAETTLIYELVDDQEVAKEQTYTLHGRWARVDDSTLTDKQHLILDAGFMIMYVVDTEKTVFYTFGESPLHQGKKLPAPSGDAANPKQAAKKASPEPNLKPTGAIETVAGVRCNIVNEIVDDKPVAEHCMADAAALGMNPREMTTMARLIQFSRDWSDPDWIAVQMKELFISIRSRPVGGTDTFLLNAVSHQTPAADYFRVPREYRKLNSDEDYTGLITGKK
jgi:hypothetical protein